MGSYRFHDAHLGGTVRVGEKVGIGTTNPESRLHIQGNSDVSDEDCMLIIDDVDGSAGSRIPSIMFRSVTGGTTTNQGRIRGTDTQGMVLSGSSALGNDLVVQSGKIGLGTNNPQTKLQVDIVGIDTHAVNTSTTSQAQVATFAAATFRSARFTVQITNTTDSTYHVTEILLIHDGTTPAITEYATIFTGTAAEATFDADITGGNVRLLATPASADTMQFRMVQHSILV